MLERAIDAFISAYDIDMADAIVPDGGFRTFDEFFTRRLRDGARPIDADEAAITSPADGKIEDFGPVDLAATVTVKGKLYEVGDLLGDDELARGYDGGSYFIIYLSPRDYHRVHTPVGGQVTFARHVAGTLYPVNSIGTEYVPRLFARNERVVTVQQSPQHGAVATIMVGAIGVGRIEMSYDAIWTNRPDLGQQAGARRYGDTGPTLERGDELGIFHLGSTAVVFLPKQADVEFVVEPGQSVRMGEAIARRCG